MSRMLLAVLALLWMPLAGWAGSSQKGTSAANFLKIHPGARAASMGGSFTGMADDIYSMYYNAAGLSQLSGPELAASHLSYFQDIDFNYLAFASPFFASGQAFGFSVTSLGVDGIEKRSSDQDSPESKFSASDYAYQLTYARKLNAAFSAGAGVKMIREVIDSQSASAYAADLGVAWKRDRGSIRGAGLSLRNAGSELKFNEVGDPLPLVVSAGAHFKFIGERLDTVVDASFPRDNNPYGSLGIEYGLELKEKSRLAFRAGYSTFIQKVDGLTGLSLGTGFMMDPFGFDFAWVPVGDLGNTFRYSLLVKF